MQRAYLDAETKVVRLPLLEGPAPARLVINDTHFLFTADFKKSGPDLILTGDDGKKLVIANYFNFEKHPDLVSPDGAVISAELVERLAGPEAPGQYAQAGAPAGAVVIGRVEIVSVNATVQHANGVVDNLKNGDSLLKGDVVMTGDGEGCTLSLIDGTALNMGSNGRMVLAELTYDSQSTSNSALINLVKGSFVFVAGQVAHTGGMRVTTPVATMGIRGTTVGTYLDADVNGNVYQLTATLLSDPGGSSGAYDLTDPVTGAVLQRVRSTATQVTLSHGANNQLSVQEETKSPAIVQHELAVAQILFPIFLANPNNAQLNQTTPQVPNNSLTPPQLLPQPPQETDPNSAVHFNLLLIGGLDAKTTSPGNNNSFILTELALINNPISIASISINAIAGNNIINLSGAQAGFAITGNETGADGQTVTVKVLDSGGNVVGSFTATAAGGNWFVGVSSDFAKALADGTYTLKATVSGTDGNPAPPATQTLTVDQTPPSAPSVALTTDSGSSNSDHITHNSALTLSGIEVGALVEYSLDSGKTWSNSFTAVEGLNTVQVRQTDVAGNVSGVTSVSFTLDTIPPVAPSVALTDDNGSSATDHITNNGGLTLSGIEAGALVEYSLDGGKTWSNSFAAVEGPNTVLVRQTDLAGNVSSATSLSFTLDTIAPAAPGVALTVDSGSSNSDHITNNGALTLSGIENGAIVQYSINNGTTWSNSFTAVEGVNTVQVRQTDVAGNVSAATTFSFTLDTHGPAAPGVALTTDSGSSNSDHITNNGALTLSGIEAGALVQYSIDNGQTWSNSFTAVEGVNTVQVRQTDVAGDVSSATSLSFTLDTHAPAAPGVALTTDSGSSNSDHITNNGALTLSGIENGAIVQYSINNGTTWSNSFTAVEGVNTVLVRQTGVAGNVSSATSLSFTLDTHAPAAPGVALTTDSGSSNSDHITNNGALTLAGIEAGALVQYSINNGTSWSNSFTAVEGPNTVLVRQTDVAGNVSSATSLSFTLDTHAPAAPGVALTTDSGSSNSDHITNNGALTLLGIENGALVQYSINNGTSWSNSFTAVEGPNTVLVRQTDVAGNVSSATSLSFTLDTHAPAAPGVALTTDSGSSNSDHITNNGALTLLGIENGALVQYSINNGTSWSNSFTAVEGVNTVLVRQTDVAGNVSSATSLSFTLDTDIGEQIVVGLSGLSGGYALEDKKITATVTDTDNDVGPSGVHYTWQVSLDGGTTWSTVGSNGNTYTPVEADEGRLLQVTASFTDLAGNIESGSTIVGVLPFLAIADNSLSVSPGGTTPLGISLALEPVPDDTISVKISFTSSGANSPTILAGDGAHNHSTSGGITTYTFSQADVISGLSFTNHGDQTDALTVSELLNGDVASTQTITVTDPPVADAVASDSSSTILSGTTLTLAGASAETITFANDKGDAGTLVLDHSASFTGQISGFAGDGTLSNSDSIDLKDIDFAAAKETYSGGILTVTDDAHTANLHFDGDYVLGNFVLASDDHGGTLVIDPPAPVDLTARFEPDHSDTGLQEAHGLAQEQTFSGFPLATADATFDQFHFGNMDLTGFNGHAHDLVPAISSFGSDHFQFAVMDTDGFHQTLMVHPLELDLHQAPLQTIVEAAAPGMHDVTPAAAELSPAASVLDIIHAIHAHTA